MIEKIKLFLFYLKIWGVNRKMEFTDSKSTIKFQITILMRMSNTLEMKIELIRMRK